MKKLLCVIYFRRKPCYGLLLVLLIAACGPVLEVREVEISMLFPHALEVVPERLEKLSQRGARLVVEVQSANQVAEYSFRFARSVRLRLHGARDGDRLRLSVWVASGRLRAAPCLLGEKKLRSALTEQVPMQLQVPANFLD
ncbi:MAG: hypothetical protein KDD51_01670 [Bdellovibrionales bacterium]|nr:hypothetical protein [Bdellovibrionales bacterium]